MFGKEALSPIMFLGIVLVIVGIVLIVLPLIARVGIRLEDTHPLILLGRRFDGIYIGTSPILIIILVVIYVVLLLLRRG
ncbi:MAG: hypothetical protein L2C94_002770 [Aigarchaeota archaeon]|jgi:uncharacterized membrane protein|nr:hypothetical protein [Candidatus Wolframiiraptor gerlachensis]